MSAKFKAMAPRSAPLTINSNSRGNTIVTAVNSISRGNNIVTAVNGNY